MYDDAYTTAIVTYAYSLYQPESNEARQSYSKLMDMAKRSNHPSFNQSLSHVITLLYNTITLSF